MPTIIDQVKAFFENWKPELAIQDIKQLALAGSDRMYFRVSTAQRPYIVTYNTNVRENTAFLEFTKHFSSKQISVPEVYHVSADKQFYVQADLGSTSLLDKLQEEGYTDHTFELYQKTLAQLARLQIQGGTGLNYDYCIATRSFDRHAIYSDLLYFKYYFLRALKLPYDKNLLLNDFEMLSYFLMQEKNKFFMHRDCQSRNVMVKDDKVYFIDYQGGMQGALQYDVASMLWQAKAALPYEWRDELFDYYFDRVNDLLNGQLKRDEFLDNYHGFVLIRMLQTLGAYGYRGLFERKPHFISSIPYALKNLKWFLENKSIPIRLPELQKALEAMTSDDIIARYENIKATDESKLVVKVHSFSYKKGLPEDPSGNGGGFVFDCRGILNPGRFAPYKKLTGRDKEVKDFLVYQTEMPTFLQHVYSLVDISVSDYLKRGFESLQVSFGCTGGQHRSVFAADSVAKHLEDKFGVKVELKHIVQEEKNWIN
ncbi:RNase adapter RapZ [Cytophagaceae bacterium ABcell3]|nr:RNase adapter RapZ [Cytophagaceae bacterium ABcell3]